MLPLSPFGGRGREGWSEATFPAGEGAILRLDGDHRGVVDARKEDRQLVERDVVVHRLARALPAEIVVDDHDPATDELRIKPVELGLGRSMPVGVEAKESDRAFGRVLR